MSRTIPANYEIDEDIYPEQVSKTPNSEMKLLITSDQGPSINVGSDIHGSNDLMDAIHQCVIHSTIRHVINIPLAIILQYLSTYPFFRSADTLYYFLLQRYGSDAHYSSNGCHLITIQPELSGVYILAEQNMKALMIKGVPSKTIYNILKKSINRTVTCERYQLRHSIITGEAPVTEAVKIPSICLNIPQYQQIYQQAATSLDVIKLLVGNDCWEAIPKLNSDILSIMLLRMSYVSSVAPKLWKYCLRQYYTERLRALQIHKILPWMTTRELIALNTLLPDLIQLPFGLNTLGVRIWYTDKITRAYLLGCDIVEGIPSNEIISSKLQKLQRDGIETYSDDITGVYLDENNKLTGKIGEYFFPNIQGKKLINTRTTLGTSIGSHYVSDLIPIINRDTVELVLIYDFMKAFKPETILTPRLIIDLIAAGEVGTMKVEISQEEAEHIKNRIAVKTEAIRSLPARTRLVEVMSTDIVNYS